jgi:hypothetical protein
MSNLGAGVLAGALLASALVTTPATGALRPAAGTDPTDLGGGPRYRQAAPQTSDGIVGPIAPPRTAARAGEPETTITARWKVAPGIRFQRFERVDDRGPIRAQLLKVDLAEPGVSVDYAGQSTVTARGPLLPMVREDGAVAGVNGDFFDIGDTGAPLGVGRDRQRKFLHGVETGWNCAFFIRRDGTPDVDFLYTTAVVKDHPEVPIATVNSPTVRQGGIGLYTPKWGTLEGYGVTDGQTEQIRFVHVLNGTVVANKTKLPKQMPVTGKVLIGRDEARKPLRRLEAGSTVRIRTRLSERTQMAITGNVFLIRDGDIKSRDDTEMHPRTAVGIDYDTNRLLFLVIDGRQKFSRGYTMVELANLMAELGADEAINLDGGGSSTMVAKRKGGGLTVVNSPSDGSQRSVPNGVAIHYTAPPPPS